MSKFPVSPDLQTMIDWCNQPAPKFAGDTHALQFFLFIDNAPFTNLIYQGYLFFHPPPVPASPRPRAFFQGSGRLTYKLGMCEQVKANPNGSPPAWVKVSLDLPPTNNTGGVSFFSTDGNGLPGTMLSEMQDDLSISSSTGIKIGPVNLQIFKTTVTP